MNINTIIYIYIANKQTHQTHTTQYIYIYIQNNQQIMEQINNTQANNNTKTQSQT